VQVSGIISDETGKIMSGVAVISHKLRRGVLSESTGIYSIISLPGDTISFRALGYKRYHTIIPYDYVDIFAIVDIRLEFDTLHIETVNILPWNTYGEFIRDITQEKPVDPIIENMYENLASIYVALQNDIGLRVSPEAAYRYVMNQQFYAISTKNQYPVNNLLNPLAWAKFVRGLRTGELFRNQSIERPRDARVRRKINNAENR